MKLLSLALMQSIVVYFQQLYVQIEDILFPYIEDATASVNDANTYEMPGLDIPDFVGCILDWSGIINVYYLDEYLLNNLL